MTNLKQCIAAWQALRAIATQAMDYKLSLIHISEPTRH